MTSALLILVIGPFLQAGDSPRDLTTRDLAAWWSFDGGSALDQVSRVEDEINTIGRMSSLVNYLYQIQK